MGVGPCVERGLLIHMLHGRGQSARGWAVTNLQVGVGVVSCAGRGLLIHMLSLPAGRAAGGRVEVAGKGSERARGVLRGWERVGQRQGAAAH